MPNIADIVEIAESLGSKHVFVAADRCVVVRNRNSTCRRCVESCPTDAVAVGGNELTIDAARCVACGACTTVCPVEALVPLEPVDEALAASIADAVLAAEGAAVFACARIASRREGDPGKFAEVPCLARMEESLLLGLAARGVDDIVLVDGTCATCKYRFCNPGIDATVASANTLLATQGSGVRVRRASAFPEQVLVEDAEGLYGVSRRGFFTQARGMAKDTAEKTVSTVLKAERNATVPALGQRLRVSEDGTLPQFEPVRRMQVLDAMDELGPSTVPEVDTRLFGSVGIDADACNACGMCAVFCPTGALAKADDDEDPDTLLLEFSASECVQCCACRDACFAHCLQVSSVVSTEELFSFEPRPIALPKPAHPIGLSRFKR